MKVGLDCQIISIFCSFQKRRPGPRIGEHADLEVGLAECVGSHQGDHLGQRQCLSINQALVYLPAGHGKGVAEELDG